MRLCSVTGCGAHHKAHGYCKPHYQQHLYGREPGTLRRYERAPQPVAMPEGPPIGTGAHRYASETTVELYLASRRPKWMRDEVRR